MKIGGHNILLSERSVGPTHDPYSEETVTVSTVRDGVEKQATWISSSLASDTLRLVVGGTVVRLEKHNFNQLDEIANKCQRTKWEILFRRHVGIDAQTAVNEFCTNYVRDPMGELSNYI